MMTAEFRQTYQAYLSIVYDMQGWLVDALGFEVGDLDTLTDDAILSLTEIHYDGGVNQFLNDGIGNPDSL